MRRGEYGLDVLTLCEASEYSGVSVNTLYRHIRKGALREVRIAGYPRLIRVIDLCRWKSGLTPAPLDECPPLTILA
jgi:excisionase family DNA binding protein